MVKNTRSGLGRLQMSLSLALGLSLSLIGLLCLYFAPKALAQDAPPPPPPAYDEQQNSAPNDQAPPNVPPSAQDPNMPAPPPAANAPNNFPSNAPNVDAAPEPGDPPSRAARISLIEGSVSIQPGGQGDWGTATRNRPLTIGDKVWSDQNSRVEIQAGQVTLHLGNMTALSFLNLDGNVTQMRIAEGSVYFRVREMREGDVYEVDTPNAAFTVKRAGAFRVDVSENGDGTRVAAIRGDGEVTAGGQTYTVHTGERAEFNGVDSNIQYVAHGAPPPDALDRWANDRDLREDNSVSARYVNRDVPGVADLDDHGTWNEEPNVGSVWYPNDVAPGWAPYSDGAWNYVGPWGWSWVGYEPWGFAPYHYGRWGFWGGRWGWAPGPIWARPYYGPAFVGFLGGGGFGFGVGIGFGFGGGVGWFPLGWGEPFHPWYHAGFGYVHNINVHNTFIRNNNVINSRNFNYAYSHNERAVTSASRSSFTNGERINRGAPGAPRVSSASLRGAQVTNGAGVSPGRSSFVGANHMGSNVARPSASIENRSVVSRNGSTIAGNRAGNNGSFNSARNQTAANRPASVGNGSRPPTRTWSAQGNVTDHGTGPRGAGQNPTNAQSNRPQWARGSSNLGNRPAGVNANRTTQPQRAYSAPNRSYSAPSRSYSAPSRTYSAPNHSSGGGSHPSSAPHASSGGHPSGGGGHAGGGGHGGGGHH